MKCKNRCSSFLIIIILVTALSLKKRSEVKNKRRMTIEEINLQSYNPKNNKNEKLSGLVFIRNLKSKLCLSQKEINGIQRLILQKCDFTNSKMTFSIEQKKSCLMVGELLTWKFRSAVKKIIFTFPQDIKWAEIR